MDRQTLRQIRGMQDLTQETIDAAVTAIAQAHRAIARQPYAILEKISLIAAPVRVIEHTQQTITDGVYSSIHAVNHIVGTVAIQVLDHLEAHTNRAE
jgi:hypothetical protein